MKTREVAATAPCTVRCVTPPVISWLLFVMEALFRGFPARSIRGGRTRMAPAGTESRGRAFRRHHGPPYGRAMNTSDLEPALARTIARVEFVLLVATAILSSVLVEGALLLQ